MNFSSDQVKKLKELSNEYKKINPFTTPLDKPTLKDLLNEGEVFLSEDNNGYMITKNLKDYIQISSIYSKLDSSEIYTQLLNNLSGNIIKYVGVYKDDALKKALVDNGFDLTREHHQLIKKLDNETKQDIEFKNLAEIESEKILEFIDLYAPDAKYELEEITKKKYRKYSFYIFDKELIGIIIAFRDPLRKNSLYLEQIVIKKSQQGKGYGKRAFRKLLFLAQREKLTHARLHVYKDNKVAYNLYTKQGFKKDKIIAYWESKDGKRRI